MMQIVRDYSYTRVNMSQTEALELIRQLAGAIEKARMRNVGSFNYSVTATDPAFDSQMQNQTPGVILFEVLND
jgi:hypothetical protein